MICLLSAHFLAAGIIRPIRLIAEDVENAELAEGYEELEPYIEAIKNQHDDVLQNALIRQEFTANVSHEFKTPLATIQGYVTLLQDDKLTNEERKKYNKKEFEYKDINEQKHIKVSTTDKESGYYHRDNKEKGFMYLDHRTTDDKCNIIVDCYITKGNVHDSEPFINRCEYIKNTFGFNIKNYAVDSGYLTLDIKKYFIDNNIFAVFGYRRYGTQESRKEKSKYIYIKDEDYYMNKETGEVLVYDGLIDRNGYKQYKSYDRTIVIRRHIKEDWNDIFRTYKLSDKGKELYQRRKEHIERSFADSKQNHGYRYAMYRGIKKNQNYTWLICAAQNMKNISIKKSKTNETKRNIFDILENVVNKVKNIFNFIKYFKIKPLVNF